MQVNLTDGQSGVTFYIDAPQEQHRIRTSARPVSVAMDIVKKRIGPEAMACLYPLQSPIVGL